MSEVQEQKKEFSPFKIAFYSGLASMVGDMLMYPLDTLGTRIKANTVEHLSMWQGYRQIATREGHMILYRGFSTTFGGSFLPYGTYFLAYEYLNSLAVKLTAKLDQNKFKHINLLIPLITAPLAEVACVISYIPFDTLRTRFQANTLDFQYKGCLDGFKQIQKTEGILRLFQASHFYIVQMIIFTSLQFWFYEISRYLLLHNENKEAVQKKKLSLTQSLSTTVVSTLLATVITNPMDVLITRFQLVDSSKHVLSFSRLMKELLHKEGKMGFFKGLGARLTLQGTFSLFYLPTYDYFKAKYGIILES